MEIDVKNRCCSAVAKAICNSVPRRSRPRIWVSAPRHWPELQCPPSICPTAVRRGPPQPITSRWDDISFGAVWGRSLAYNGTAWRAVDTSQQYDKKLHAGIEWMDDTVKLRLLPCENPVVDRLAFDVDRLT